jgi:hypothetical protein
MSDKELPPHPFNIGYWALELSPAVFDAEYFMEDVLAYVERNRDVMGVKRTPPDNDYEAERWCENCKEYTNHFCRDTQHERDSSGDYQKCLTCEWYKIGMAGTYYPPLD